MKYSFICRSLEEEKAEISKIIQEQKVFTICAMVNLEESSRKILISFSKR
jgi:hypothetical protein